MIDRGLKGSNLGTLHLARRDDGGVQLWIEDGVVEEFYLSGSAENVFADLGLVLRAILIENHDIDWLKEGEEHA